MPHFKISKTMKGQHSEFIAAAWLIKQNYLVYKQKYLNLKNNLIKIEKCDTLIGIITKGN